MQLNASAINDDYGLNDRSTVVFVKSKDEAVTITDTGRQLIWVLDWQELLTTFDELVKSVITGGSGQVYTKNVVDNLTVIDGLFDWLLRTRLGGESVLVADQVIEGVRRFRLTTDNLTVIESPLQREFYVDAYEEVTVSDSASSFKTLYRWVTENLSVTDGYVFTRLLVRALGDAITIIDGALSSVTGAGAVIVRTASDTLTIGDGVTTYMLRRRSLDESLTIADVIVEGAVRNRRFDDFISQVVDYSNKELWKLRGDTLIVSEQQIKSFLRVISATDSLTLADGVVTAFVKVRALTDLLQITDETLKALFSAITFDIRIVLGAEDRIVVGSSLDAMPIVGRGTEPEVGSAHDGMPSVGEDTPFIVLGGYH